MNEVVHMTLVPALSEFVIGLLPENHREIPTPGVLWDNTESSGGLNDHRDQIRPEHSPAPVQYHGDLDDPVRIGISARHSPAQRLCPRPETHRRYGRHLRRAALR